MNIDSSRASRMIKDDEMIHLDSLAKLTGFPVEKIKEELLIEGTEEGATESISLGSLRAAMLNYLDSGILKEEAEPNK